MSNPKLKPPPQYDPTPISVLRPRRTSAPRHVVWGLVPPKRDESCRWQAFDGRWIAIEIGTGDEFGRIVVTDSTGRRELVESYEGGLALARQWRGA